MGQSGLEGFTIYEKFYSVNGYEIDYDIDFTAANNTYIYWGVEDQMYRYQLGSMQQPQVVTLDSSLAEQSTTAMQVGYLITGSGNVLEESDSRLVLKNFEDDSSFIILDNVGTITLVGMDNDGENVYFISEDNSLYSKAVESRSNPKRIASKVTAAVSTSDGLYFLQESENQPEPVIGESGEVEEAETATDLMYLPHGEKPAGSCCWKTSPASPPTTSHKIRLVNRGCGPSVKGRAFLLPQNKAGKPDENALS